MKTNQSILRKSGLYWLVLLLSAGLTGCIKIDYFPCEQPRLAEASETRTFTAFSGVEVQLGAEVRVARGEEYLLQLTAPGNFLDLIDTRVAGQTLKISTERCLKCQPEDIQIHITLPEVDHLKLSGSGVLELLDPFEGSQMTIELYGSGNIYAGLRYNCVRTRIYGSGDLELSGKVFHHDALITGSGNLVCFPLDSETAGVTITGSGNAYLLVRDELEARITGSGNIFFRGNPWIQSQITGTGELVQIH